MRPFFDLSLLEKPFYRDTERTITYRDFFTQCLTLSKALPPEKHLVNLCTDRYLFSLSFFAIILAGKTNLLPHNRTNGAIEKLKDVYADLSVFEDHLIDLPAIQKAAKGEEAALLQTPPVIDEEHIAAVMFTSGSTGEATPHLKKWRAFAAIPHLIAVRFNFEKTAKNYLVATVPQQHMYGLETSIMLPFSGYASAYRETAFYPQDIAAAFEKAEAGEKKILITTPVHLDILLRSGETSLQSLDFVLSATAPLSRALAQKIEEKYQTHVYEIYGCTEAGVVATRRTVEGDEWRLLDDFLMEITDSKAGEATVSAPRIATPVPLGDIIKITGEKCFTLEGRQADMLNIAGKRASLEGLNTILREIEGVDDGVFFQTKGRKVEEAGRLVAFIVGDKNPQEILAVLKKEIDPVFFPRKIYTVHQIPRNAVGKIQRKEIEALYKNES
ncbi:MAG: AMP-binding protein [Alphaproteobacteria bacterium]